MPPFAYASRLLRFAMRFLESHPEGHRETISVVRADIVRVAVAVHKTETADGRADARHGTLPPIARGTRVGGLILYSTIAKFVILNLNLTILLIRACITSTSKNLKLSKQIKLILCCGYMRSIVILTSASIVMRINC